MQVFAFNEKRRKVTGKVRSKSRRLARINRNLNLTHKRRKKGNGGAHLWKEERLLISTSTLLLQQQPAPFGCLVHGHGGGGAPLGSPVRE
jgi:hypothetical protein